MFINQIQKHWWQYDWYTSFEYSIYQRKTYQIEILFGDMFYLVKGWVYLTIYSILLWMFNFLCINGTQNSIFLILVGNLVLRLLFM